VKHKVVFVQNVTRLLEAYEYLRDANFKLPKVGLVHGFAGAGKSTAISYLSHAQGGCYVRATAAWTPRTMLKAILRNLGRDDINGNNQEQLDEINRLLQIAQKPLFIDEADYLFDRRGLLDLLRDIHDVAGVPLLLVGMERISRKVTSRELVASRVSQEVKFTPLTLEDACKVAEGICEVEVAEELVADLHEKAGGSIRRITVGLAQVEAWFLPRGEVATLAPWKAANKPYFLER